MEIDVKLNDYNLVIVSGQVSSVEQTEHEQHKYTRFYLKHESNNGRFTIPCYLFDADGRYYNLMSGIGNWLIYGKLRYNERKNKYKLIGVEAEPLPKGANVNCAVIEALITNKELLPTGELMVSAMHLTLRKSAVLDAYKLPIKVFFSRNRAEAVNDKADEFRTYLIEGKLRYDAPTKSFGLNGKHVKDTVAIERPLNIEVQGG